MAAAMGCPGAALTGLAKRRWQVPGPPLARVVLCAACVMASPASTDGMTARGAVPKLEGRSCES
jgi:hypothetical protein